MTGSPNTNISIPTPLIPVLGEGSIPFMMHCVAGLSPRSQGALGELVAAILAPPAPPAPDELQACTLLRVHWWGSSPSEGQGESGSQYGLQPHIKMLSYCAMTSLGIWERSVTGESRQIKAVASVYTHRYLCVSMHVHCISSPSSLLACSHPSPPLYFEKKLAVWVVDIFLDACVVSPKF